jgi:hypothetical protein
VARAGLPDDPVVIEDLESESALADLVTPWVTESNGRCQTVTVEGGPSEAIRGLGLSRARTGPITSSTALAWMGWAGASGGAHGRRRGAAAGRYGAWWVVSTLCEIPWPPHASEVAEAVDRLSWIWFDDGAPGTGWKLRLAVGDPRTGLAWAVSAVDAAD